MPHAGFEPSISVLEPSKNVCDIDHAVDGVFICPCYLSCTDYFVLGKYRD
jgi:hypothetical protein